MPKKVMELLLQRMIQDIQDHYQVGDSYRTVREIAARFEVSLQTAHKAVSRLADDGILETRPKSGTTVLAHHAHGKLLGVRVLAVCGVNHRSYNRGYIAGINDAVKPLGGEVIPLKAFCSGEYEATFNSYAFAEQVEQEYARHGAQGICVSSMVHSVLPLFHLYKQGVPVISNLEYSEIPFLPSVMVDNRKGIDKAIDYFIKRGKKQILTVSEWEEFHERQELFYAQLKERAPEIEAMHITTRSLTAVRNLHEYFETFQQDKGVFVFDYSGGCFIVPYMLGHGIPINGNLLVFDAEEDQTYFKGHGPVNAVAPSVRTLGRMMAERLLQRIENGVWPEPLHERI